VRHAADGKTQNVTIKSFDAGSEENPINRFHCTAITDDGRFTMGNLASTAEEALSIVQWRKLDHES
jgi:hypothetical protein